MWRDATAEPHVRPRWSRIEKGNIGSGFGLKPMCTLAAWLLNQPAHQYFCYGPRLHREPSVTSFLGHAAMSAICRILQS